MRYSDAIEKVPLKLPALLVPYKKKILQRLSKIEQLLAGETLFLR